MSTVNIPRAGEQLTLGTASLFVFEVDASGDHSTGYGRFNIRDARVIVTCHDDNGDEVEIRLPFPECERHGGIWGEDETCETCTDEDGDPIDLSTSI